MSFPPGPVRPSLVNLITTSSPVASMLMQALVRTPDQHETMVTSNPFLKPSNRTCLQVAGLQELANAPGIYISQNIETVSKLVLLSL